MNFIYIFGRFIWHIILLVLPTRIHGYQQNLNHKKASFHFNNLDLNENKEFTKLEKDTLLSWRNHPLETDINKTAILPQSLVANSSAVGYGNQGINSKESLLQKQDTSKKETIAQVLAIHRTLQENTIQIAVNKNQTILEVMQLENIASQDKLASPTNVRVKPIRNKRSVRVTWDPPRESEKAVIIAYSLIWRIAGTTRNIGTINIMKAPGKPIATSALVQDLSVNTRYQFAVQAISLHSSSPFTLFAAPIEIKGMPLTANPVFVCNNNCRLTTVIFGVLLCLFVAMIFLVPIHKDDHIQRDYQSLSEDGDGSGDERKRRRRSSDLYDSEDEEAKKHFADLVEREVSRRISLQPPRQLPRKVRERSAIHQVVQHLATQRSATQDIEAALAQRKVSAHTDASFEHLSEQEINEHEYLEFIRSLLEGLVITKHNMSGSKPGKRVLHINEDLDVVYWTKVNVITKAGKFLTKRGKSRMEVASMTKVLTGMASATFARRGNPEKASLYLSVVAGNITLDIEASDENEYRRLVHGFNTLIQDFKHGGREAAAQRAAVAAAAEREAAAAAAAANE